MSNREPPPLTILGVSNGTQALVAYEFLVKKKKANVRLMLIDLNYLDGSMDGIQIMINLKIL